MKNVLFFVYLLVVGTLISCKSVDPTLIGPPRQPLYDYSEMNYYGYNGKDSCFYILNTETNEMEQYILEETRYVVVTADTYYLIRFENR